MVKMRHPRRVEIMRLVAGLTEKEVFFQMLIWMLGFRAVASRAMLYRRVPILGKGLLFDGHRIEKARP
jgi:hypothetical protein